MHTVCVCAEMTGHTLDLPHQTLPVFKKKIKKIEQQASRATKWRVGEKKQNEREHIEKRLSHETLFFLSFFPAKVAESASKLVKRQTKQLWQTVMGTLHLQSVFGLTQLLRSFGLCS